MIEIPTVIKHTGWAYRQSLYGWLTESERADVIFGKLALELENWGRYKMIGTGLIGRPLGFRGYILTKMQYMPQYWGYRSVVWATFNRVNLLYD